jgi:hypothetical protein
MSIVPFVDVDINYITSALNQLVAALQVFSESSMVGIVAGTTRTQAGATALTAGVNRVDTATAPSAGSVVGDGVKLPASVAGQNVTVVNNTVYPITVYGTGADTINGVAAATGVSIAPGATEIFKAPAVGGYNFEGGFGASGQLTTSLFCPNYTAHAGGGQASATLLAAEINRISVVASQGDSVKLPPAVAGLDVFVINRGANPVQVFGSGTDTVNGIATATGVSQGVATEALYTCTVAGNWEVPINMLWSTTPALIAASGALPPHVAHEYMVTAGSAAAMTLAAPTAGVDDGLIISISSSTAFAHTLTATGLLQTGSAAVNVATFAAFAGAGVTLMAYNGKWVVAYALGCTFT